MENLKINTGKLFIDKNKILILVSLIIFFLILEIKSLETLMIIICIVLIFIYKDKILKKIKSLQIEKFINNNKSNDLEMTNNFVKNLNISEDHNEINRQIYTVNNPAGNNIPGSKFINDLDINECSKEKSDISLDNEINKTNKIMNHLINNDDKNKKFTKKYLERTFYKVPNFHNDFNKNLHNLNPTKKEQFLEACNYKSELLK